MIDLMCDWKASLLVDPTKKARCGYLTAFDGIGGLSASSNRISTYTPFNAGPPEYPLATLKRQDASSETIDCIGLVEHFSWGGGAGDPISISAYVTAELANQLKGMLKTTLSSTTIKRLGWWIVNYDIENKAWFEEAFPKTADGIVSGQFSTQGKAVALQVSEEPTRVASNIDVDFFSIFFEVVPSANAIYALQFAQGKTKPYVKSWGLQVGKSAKGAS